MKIIKDLLIYYIYIYYKKIINFILIIKKKKNKLQIKKKKKKKKEIKNLMIYKSLYKNIKFNVFYLKNFFMLEVYLKCLF